MPMLERFKFLCISAKNLDEHFSKQLGSCITLDPEDLALFSHKILPDLRPKNKHEQSVDVALHAIIDRIDSFLHGDILPAFKSHGIEIVQYDEVPEHQQQMLDSYFDKYLGPVLTPIVRDSTHPFPMVHIHDMYIIAVIVKPLVELKRHVIVRIPTKNRLIAVDSSKSRFVSVEDVCVANIGKVCRGMILGKAYPLRVTRNIKLTFEGDAFGNVENVLDYVIYECHRRQGAPATRMEVLENTPAEIIHHLTHDL